VKLTPYWVGCLASDDGLLITLKSPHRAAELKPGDVLALSYEHAPFIGMPLRTGRLTVMAVDPERGEILCDAYLHRKIPAALTAASCDCPDHVYRVGTASTS
jgi:hypothetical protein